MYRKKSVFVRYKIYAYETRGKNAQSRKRILYEIITNLLQIDYNIILLSKFLSEEHFKVDGLAACRVRCTKLFHSGRLL